MSPKTRRSRSREASEPAREEGEAAAAANVDGIVSVIDADARASVAALITPDADALAAVCNSDSDEDEDFDTGDVTIREGDSCCLGRERGRNEGKREGKTLLASFSTPSTSTPDKKKKGDELATYIFVDLPRDAPSPPPGSSVTITGLETASPSIEFGAEKEEKKGGASSSSSSFSAEGGEWKESVGSLLFVAKGQATKTAESPPAAPPPGSYLCHTERVLSFRKEES